MIFITLGTQDKKFLRLLEEVERLIQTGVIQDEVIVQAGYTQFESNSMQVFDYVNGELFNTYIENCDALITHGGVGSILNAITREKKVIAIARLEKYGEHENDHQVEIVSKFAKLQYILGCIEIGELEQTYQSLKTFIPAKYAANNAHFCELIDKLIG